MRLAVCLPAFFLLVSCAVLELPRTGIIKKATASGFEMAMLQGEHFNLFSLQRFSAVNTSSSLVVYIEGDGRSWRSRHAYANDPTPTSTLVFDLARQDPADNVLYLARPCQYLPDEQLAECLPRYWTSHRYAPAVISDYVLLLQALVDKNQFSEITLVGYSGGGVVAMLVASRLHSKVNVITLAANLDHHAWTQYHRVSDLSGSLDLMNETGKLAVIPQLHLTGGEDEVVPSALNNNFFAQMPASSNVVQRVIPHYDHVCCWAEEWLPLMHTGGVGVSPR